MRLVLLFLLISAPVFSQSQSREQGLITSDPFWRQALGGAVLSLPSVQAQSAVVALDGGNIRAYSTAGKPMWNYSARGRISPYVSRSREGTSYISRNTGVLIAVNRAGRELWRRNMDSQLSARVVVGWDGRLFAPTEGKLYCFTASGTLLWATDLKDKIALAPILDRSGGILFSLRNNEVMRVDPFGNTQVWTLSKTPAVLLSINQERIAVLYADANIEVLGSPQDWYISAGSESRVHVMPRLPASPLAAVSMGNNLAITMNDGRVTLFSIDERKSLWTGESHIRVMLSNRESPVLEAEMIFDERGIYILSKNGATGFSHDGRRLWFSFLQNAAAVPAFGDDGVLYSGGTNWILYAYKIEDRVLPQRNALYGPAPQGAYGMGRPKRFEIFNIPFSQNETKNMLDTISSAVNSGTVGANEPVWTTFLLNVSAGEEPIQFRLAALNLLGKIGSVETVPWLINIFRRESEPVIRGAALAAIGDIGVDPQGAALETFLNVLTQTTTRNEHVLTAMAAATGALCRFSGPPLSETGIRILNLLTLNHQPPSVRRQARRELGTLK